ncbi:hypothetical protein [Planococcus rifietoensis]|uniref:hypothetical protein n=1 Tax=Planococcus rifietoensis TaxID=200991 RepID=UPI00384F7A1D
MNINLDTLANYGAFIASLVSIGTLWNVSRQRIHSNKPDLHIKSKKINIEFVEKNEFPKFRGTDNDSGTLVVYNIGLGTAKNIEFEWAINKKTFEKLKKYDLSSKYSIDGQILGRITLSSEEKEEKKRYIRILDIPKQQVDFILPYKSDSNSNETIFIPTGVSIIYGIYAEYLYDKEKSLDQVIFENFNVRLIVKYQDITGKPYKDVFNFKMGYISYGFRNIYGKYEIIK